jgi:putative DNA primase/helicase
LVTVTADEVLATRDRANSGSPAKRDSVAQWLAQMLAEGPVPVATLREEAAAAGHSWGTVRRAYKALGVTAEKADFTGGWAWRLPEEASPGAEIEL